MTLLHLLINVLLEKNIPTDVSQLLQRYKIVYITEGGKQDKTPIHQPTFSK